MLLQTLSTVALPSLDDASIGLTFALLLPRMRIPEGEGERTTCDRSGADELLPTPCDDFGRWLLPRDGLDGSE